MLILVKESGAGGVRGGGALIGPPSNPPVEIRVIIVTGWARAGTGPS